MIGTCPSCLSVKFKHKAHKVDRTSYNGSDTRKLDILLRVWHVHRRALLSLLSERNVVLKASSISIKPSRASSCPYAYSVRERGMHGSQLSSADSFFLGALDLCPGGELNQAKVKCCSQGTGWLSPFLYLHIIAGFSSIGARSAESTPS